MTIYQICKQTPYKCETLAYINDLTIAKEYIKNAILEIKGDRTVDYKEEWTGIHLNEENINNCEYLCENKICESRFLCRGFFGSYRDRIFIKKINVITEGK